MIDYTTARPLQEAVAEISGRTPMGSRLSSREWALVPAEIRQRALFSARVEDERILAEIKRRLLSRVSLEKSEGRTMDKGVFIEEMREELRQSGYKRGKDVKRGSLQDLKSTRRLSLIWDMNLAQAQGYARWKADMTAEGLENEPCYELIRVMDRMDVRDWPLIWLRKGGDFYDGVGSNDDYPNAAGRMIALKTDPIWRAISRFNTPWPPFDWGSGMGLRGVSRDEADAFGITGPADELVPQDVPFNGGAKMSVADLDEAERERILDDLAGEVVIAGDDIVMLPPEKLEPGFSIPALAPELKPLEEQATKLLDAASDAQKEAITAALKETVSYQNLKTQSGSGWDEDAALKRALIQQLAETGGQGGAIRAARRGPVRDAWWTAMDFIGVAAVLAGLIGGAA